MGPLYQSLSHIAADVVLLLRSAPQIFIGMLCGFSMLQAVTNFCMGTWCETCDAALYAW
jgi:hypothetical protein